MIMVELKALNREHDSIRRIQEALEQKGLSYSSSSLLELFPDLEDETLNSAIKRALKVFRSKDMNSREHFRKIYCSAGKEVRTEWQLSSLSYNLVLLYCKSDSSLLVKI